jgi:hypothetical protein
VSPFSMRILCTRTRSLVRFHVRLHLSWVPLLNHSSSPLGLVRTLFSAVYSPAGAPDKPRCWVMSNKLASLATLLQMMVTRPVLSFYDGYTRGLDSATALRLAKTLASVCWTSQGGMTLIASQYQASQEIFDVFDKVSRPRSSEWSHSTA